MSDLITVAIAAYNHAAFIGEAIESALSQAVDLDIVIVDDASTDATAKVAESYAARDPRIRIFRHEKNRGPAAATATFIEKAKGSYIVPLPSDDAFEPGKLAAQLEYMQKHPNAAMVATGAAFMNEHSAPITHARHFAANLFSAKPRTRGQWLRFFFTFGNDICASGPMIRTSIARQIPQNIRLLQLQDYDWWVRFVLAGYDIGTIDRPLTRYRIRAGQANLSAPSRESQARHLYEHIKVLERFYALKTVSELRLIAPDEADQMPPGVMEEVYVQHRLSSHAWELNTPHHRMFALDNWYRMLGENAWLDSLEKLGVTARFFSAKESRYPLAKALRFMPKSVVRRQIEFLLPTGLRNMIARHVKKRRLQNL